MKILVPIDGSTYSANALEFVASRTTLLGQNPELRLLLVLQPLPVRAASMIAPEGVKQYFEGEADKVLKPVRKFLKKHCIQAEERVLQGEPAEVIAKEAEDFGADLIIMGSRGRTALEGLFLGSVTQGVLARTKHPILLLRGKPAPEEDALRVGICVDGSSYGKTVVKYVLSHRELFGRAAKFDLLTVSEDLSLAAMPDMGFGMPTLSKDEVKALEKETTDKAFESVRPLFAKAELKPKEVALVGKAGEEIAYYAKKKLNMLVMGSHGYGRFKSAVLGSTTTRVASSGDIPILVIRQ